VSKGELCTIVALPSSGKSNVCEGIVAAYARAKGFEPLDALNFVYPAENSTSDRKVLWVDTERTPNDILWSVKRLKNRCNVTAAELSTYLDFYSFAEIAAANDALTTLKILVGSGLYDMVILDGIFDFCPDINHIEKATQVVKELRAMAVKHDVSIVTTIHPNKGTDTIAGHLGAMLYRFSRAILYIEKLPNGIRRLTNEIGQGKLSYSSEPANSTFIWSDASGMFIVCDAPDTTTATNYDITIVDSIFAGATTIASSTFKSEYIAKTGLSKKRVDALCLQMQSDEILKRSGVTTNTIYTLLSSETIPF